MTERRTIRRAAEEAIADPRLGLPAKFAQQSDVLPPGFAGRPVRDNYAEAVDSGPVTTYAPHPMSRPTSTQLQFRVRPTPWYRSRGAKLAIVGVAMIAAIVSVVLVLWPDSSTAPQDSGATTSPAPAPSATPTTVPSASLAPPAPPSVLLPPPPPPPPPAESSAPPPAAPPQQYYPQPRYNPPPSNKPEIGVTRAPISVSPSVKPSPGRVAPKPGDTSRGGGFGFW